MKKTPPLMMKALFMGSPGSELHIKNVEVPEPGKGEVLVKMRYAPINPSDLSQLRGTMSPLPEYPFIPGIEGSGTVIASGKGIIPSLRKGRDVACSPKGKGGTWAEYMVTDATKCIPLGKGINLEYGSMLIVNPMTLLAMIDIAEKGNHRSLVNNAASGSLGIMMTDICKRRNIKLINIVRNKSQFNLLKEKGEKYILDSSDSDFRDEYRKLTRKLNSTLIFDAVGGKQTEILIKESPEGSRIILYANLSNDSFTSDSRDILQHGKTIEGFSLPLWTADKSIFHLLRHIGRVKTYIASGQKQNIRKIFNFSEINSALKEYKDNMTGGKVLLNFQPESINRK